MKIIRWTWLWLLGIQLFVLVLVPCVNYVDLVSLHGASFIKVIFLIITTIIMGEHESNTLGQVWGSRVINLITLYGVFWLRLKRTLKKNFSNSSKLEPRLELEAKLLVFWFLGCPDGFCFCFALVLCFAIKFIIILSKINVGDKWPMIINTVLRNLSIEKTTF